MYYSYVLMVFDFFLSDVWLGVDSSVFMILGMMIFFLIYLMYYLETPVSMI